MAYRKTKFSKTMIAVCAATSMLASTNLHALGLGNFEVQSNLDQPLRGTIQLRTEQGDDVKSITAVIASREDYEKFGIDYPSYLKDIKLVLDRSSGTPVLRVSSEEIIIKEPFIHFLVRVDWSGGSFLREYTALIDPPMYAAEAPENLSEPKLAGTTETIYPDEDISSSLDEAPVVEEQVASSDMASEETEEVTEPADEEVLFEEEVTQLPTDAQYGPVEQGESLSVIAQELQSQFPDLSIYQIMQVMFNENQGAFIGGNMNGLMKGAVLKIGDMNAIRSVDAVAAKKFFYDQVQEWNPAALASSSSDSSDDALRVGQDEYTAGNESLDNDLFTDTSSDDVPAATDSFQVGSSSDIDQATSSVEGASREGEVLALQKQITELETSLSSSSRENRELTERISLLEGQLADMNRLLSVKDADMAAVQSNLAEQASAQVEETPAVDEELNDVLVDQAENVVDEAVLTDDQEILDDESTLIDDGVLNDSSVGDDEVLVADDEILVTDDSADDLVAESELIVDEEPVIDASDSVIEDVAEENVAVTTTPVSVAEKKSFLDVAKSKLIDDGLWKVGAGVLGLLGAGLGLFVMRRRRADEEFEVSMLSIETNTGTISSTMTTTKTVAASTISTHSESEAASEIDDDSRAAEGETSFLTVYSDSDAVVQADEVDPIAEADVYIAYGRDEQAEEVLIDGIANNPGRVDIHKKLLTLYHKNNNVEGFERVAEELYSQKSILNKEVWDEISLMGKDVSPENPLFDVSSSDILAASDESEQLVDSASVASIDRDSTPESSDEDSINDISFDDGHSQRSEFTNVDVLDIEDDNKPTSIEDDEEFIELSSSAEGDDIIDITSKKAEPEDSESLDDESQDDDDALEFESVELNDVASELEEDDEESGLTAEVSDLEIDEDYDEARTQYELAKVFVDLGDEDGARKILDELVADSSNDPEVLSDAKKLLEEMDA